MKYIITRTSGAYAEPAKPIPTAHAEKIHERRSIKLPKDENNEWVRRFIDSCHGIERKKGVMTGFLNEPEEVWVDEIFDLHAFVEKYGRIILSKPSCEEGLWSVEIYDDYRE